MFFSLAGLSGLQTRWAYRLQVYVPDSTAAQAVAPWRELRGAFWFETLSNV